MNPPPPTPFSFTIQLGDETLRVAGSVPGGACDASDLVPLLQGLAEAIVAAASRQSAAAKTISCGPGCGACCRQLVPISLTEAAYLREVVLPALTADHRRRVVERLAEAAVALRKAKLREVLRDLPDESNPERRQAVGLRYFLTGIACPFLEEESCSIHPQRPLACREYLVVSPAAHCARPEQGGIEPVTIPRKPSHAMIQLDAAATGGRGWRPMIEALLDEAELPARRVLDPIGFLRNFLEQLLG